MRLHNPNGTSIGSVVFAQMTAECFYTLQWFACFPLKIASSHVGIWTSCNTWFIGPTRVRNANGKLIVSVVFAGLTSVTDWQSDRQTDRPRYSVRCGVITRNYVGYGKATKSFHVSRNNFATIKSVSVRSRHLIKYLVHLISCIAFGNRLTVIYIMSFRQARLYCGHGRPSQLLLSSCSQNPPFWGQFSTVLIFLPKTALKLEVPPVSGL